MANLQYIGARYVPKIMGSWNANTAYEALSIVLDANNNSYTSKKAVPAGTELTNDEYWVLTGPYSANISSLQTQVNGLSRNVTQLINDVSDLESIVSQLGTGKYIIIGDSYLNENSHPNNVLTYLRRYLNLSEGADLWSSAVSGNGFYKADGGASTGNGFLQQLQTYSGSMQNSEVDHIIVLGGMNDRHAIEDGGANDTTIITAINAFCATAAQLFPNAKVYIGQIGTSRLRTVRILLRNVTREYEAGCAQNSNAVYLQGSNYCMKNYALFDDNNHPNSAGFESMAVAIANAIKSGGSNAYPKQYPQLQAAIEAYGDGSSITTATFNSMYFNSGVRVNLSGALTYTLNTPISNTTLINNQRYYVGKVDYQRCFGAPIQSQYQPGIFAMAILSDNSMVPVDYCYAHFEEEGNDLVFRPLIRAHFSEAVTVKGFYFYSGSMFFDITEV